MSSSRVGNYSKPRVLKTHSDRGRDGFSPRKISSTCTISRRVYCSAFPLARIDLERLILLRWGKGQYKPNHMENEQKPSSGGNKFAIPASIVVAGIIIGGAVIYSNNIGGEKGTATARDAFAGENEQAPNPLDNMRPITPEDHIRGNPNAPVKIVEFSDLECPFCKVFHGTMKQAIKEYGDRVAWVYRHFPLDSLHPKARKEAEATECANELGGPVKFWTYIDRLFEVTPSNNGLALEELPRIAEAIGLNKTEFQACLASGKYAQLVENDYRDAVGSGGEGTPYNVVIAADGTKIPFVGAQPYDAVKAAIERALTAK